MMGKKKIAFYGIKYYPSKGGSSRVAEWLADELKDRYEITVHCYGNPQAKNYLKGVKVVEWPELPLGAIGVFLYYLVSCFHLLCFGKYDLIHVHKTDSALFIPLLRLKSKIIATSQEAPYRRDKWNFIGKSYFRTMEWFFIHSSHIMTSVSKPLADYYQNRYRKIVHFVPNGINIKEPSDPQKADAILNELGVKEYVFFAARRIMSTKGCHTMLEGMTQINYPHPILIAGEESHASRYMEKLKKSARQLDVKFIGYIADKPTLLALIEKARYFVFPSETEGLSLMLLEAANRGKTPIICSDIPENTQVFNQDEVLYFKNKDSEHFARQLNWAEDNCQQMSERMVKARQKVHKEFTSSAIASKYENLYQRLYNIR